MKYEKLIGKTIVAVKQKKLIGHDDDGFLEMLFSDGTKATIVACYESNCFITVRRLAKAKD